MHRRLLALAMLAGACAPSNGGAPTRLVDDDTSDTSDSGGDDTGSKDTGSKDTGDDDTGPDPAEPCHPYDPIEPGPSGWRRTYRLVDNVSVAIFSLSHRSLGQRDLPDTMQGAAQANTLPTRGWAYEDKTQLGQNPATVLWRRCDGAGRLQTFATDYEHGSFAWAESVAQQPAHHLPPASEMEATKQPGWTTEVTWEEGLWTPACGTWQARTTTSTLYTGRGMEEIEVAPLGKVDAWHLTFDRTSTVTFVSGDASGMACAGGREPQRWEQWFVEGVGLVRSHRVDPAKPSTVLYDQEMTACSGLPGCP